MDMPVYFSGDALAAVDDKGRLALPAFLRNKVAESSRGDRRLCIRKHEKWNCLVGYGLGYVDQQMAEIDREEQLARDYKEPFDRHLAQKKRFSGMKEVSFDASGRFQMPRQLAAKIGMGNLVFFFGSGPYFCMWTPEALQAAGEDFADEQDALEFYLAEMDA